MVYFHRPQVFDELFESFPKSLQVYIVYRRSKLKLREKIDLGCVPIVH